MDLGAILDAIKIWVEGVIQVMGYPGLVLVMFLENVFPPIPSEVVLPLAGNLTHTTSFTIFWVIFWGMIGSLLGAFLFYFLGKWFKEERVYWLVEKVGKYALIKTDDLDHAFEFFEKYGEWTIFFGRMVPIVRSLISIPAGLAEMNLIKFTIYSILGSSLWNLVLVMGGRLLGPQWPRIIEWVGIYQDVVIYLSIAAVVLFFAIRITRTIREKKANAANPPK